MRRIRRTFLILLAIAILTGGGWFCWILAVNAARARRAIARGVFTTISAETTVATAPLRKDGYVNYVGALNLRGAEGVTPENNAAVLFWRAVGPREIRPEARRRFFQMLNMSLPPDHGNYFTGVEDYAQQQRDAGNAQVPKLAANFHDPVSDKLALAMQRPWSKEEFPLVASALAANEKPLALLAEASKRPRCYFPLLCGDNDEGEMMHTLLWHLHVTRRIGDVLVARAMLRLNGGDVTGCWDDLLACHRLARLIGQGPLLLDAVVAFDVDGRANAGDRAVLARTSLSAGQASSMREALAKLPPLPRMADKIDVAERFMYLDMLAAAAREGFIELNGAAVENEPASASLDWDLMLRIGNSWYDRTVAAARKLTRSERLAELDKIDKSLIEVSKSNSDWKSLVAAVAFDKRSERIANMVVCLTMPATGNVLEAEDRGTMEAELIRVGFALTEYRADHGSYPKQLGELVPRYVAKVPTDIFADDSDLHYRQKGTGYMLYSVGPNGRDDDGHTSDEGTKAGIDWDDLSVQVP